MKFLVDMAVTPQAVPYLQDRGHDAVHVSAIGLSSRPDSEILDRARAEGRIVVTSDLDYPRRLALLKAGSPGVILFRGAVLRSIAIPCLTRTWSSTARTRI